MAAAADAMPIRNLPLATFCYYSESTGYVTKLRNALQQLTQSGALAEIHDLIGLPANQAMGLNAEQTLVMLLERLVTVDQLLNLKSTDLNELRHCLDDLMKGFRSAGPNYPERLARFARFLLNCTASNLGSFSASNLAGLIGLAGPERSVALFRRLEAPLGHIRRRQDSPFYMYFSRLENDRLRHSLEAVAVLQNFNFHDIFSINVDGLIQRMFQSRVCAGQQLSELIKNGLLELAAVILFELLEDLQSESQPRPNAQPPFCVVLNLSRGDQQSGFETVLRRSNLFICSNGSRMDPDLLQCVRCEDTSRMRQLAYSVEFEDWNTADFRDDYVNSVMPAPEQLQRSIFLFVLDEPLFDKLARPDGSHARSLLARCLATNRPLFFLYRDCDRIFNGLLEMVNSLQRDAFRRQDVDSFRFPARCPRLRPSSIISWLSYRFRYGLYSGTGKADFVTMQNLLRYLRYLDSHEAAAVVAV